jgi:hypothetical protein
VLTRVPCITVVVAMAIAACLTPAPRAMRADPNRDPARDIPDRYPWCSFLKPGFSLSRILAPSPWSLTSITPTQIMTWVVPIPARTLRFHGVRWNLAHTRQQADQSLAEIVEVDERCCIRARDGSGPAERFPYERRPERWLRL